MQSAVNAQARPEAAVAAAISAEFPFESKFVAVLGSRMHYVDEGHGSNPTSSYLWRNVMPHLEPQGRVIALDLIGMGESDKPDIDYTYHDHIRYVEGFIDALNLQNITLVIHDWGSALGFDYMSRHEYNMSGIAFMEAIVPPFAPIPSYDVMGSLGPMFRAWRTSGTGEQLILEQNQFVEQILGGTAVARKLTEEEMAHYRAPYPDAASRKPTLVWPREVPIAGEPARNVQLVRGYLESVFVGQGIHFIQEDQPEIIGRAIADWRRRNIR